MDNAQFFAALSQYRNECTIAVCKPDGFFLTNTGSEVTELQFQNVSSPPFRLCLFESNPPPETVFRLQTYAPEDQKEIVAILNGTSKVNSIVALNITNTGLCKLLCARWPKPAPSANSASGAATTVDEKSIKLYEFSLNTEVERIRFKAEYGIDTAYLIEQERYQLDYYKICHTSITEVIGHEKTRRLTHVHNLNSHQTSQTWQLTDFLPTPT